jgi:tetratricopeptide (TPR) repeat protein
MPDSGKIALIIGIDQYNSNELDSLPSSKKDANDLKAELLKLEFQSFRNSPIIGSEIAKEEMGWAKIRETICDFFLEAKPSQLLLFYFSGHGITGGNDVFLSTPNIDPKNPRSRGFSLSELTNCMGSSKSRQIIGIIDACYSGGANLPNSGLKKAAADSERKQALATYDKVWKKTPKTKGISLLLSSRSYEPSNALKDDNSLYTKYLLEGLRGVKGTVDQNGITVTGSGSIDEAGFVTPQSLHDYVYDKVANITEQVPELKSDQSGKIIIAFYPKLTKQITVPTPESLDSPMKENGIKSGETTSTFVEKTVIGESLGEVDGLLALASMYISQNDYGKAEEYLQRVMKKNPQNTDILCEVANNIEWIGESIKYDHKYSDPKREAYNRHLQAKELCEKALAINPNDRGIIGCLEKVYAKIGDYFNDIKMYKEAIENFRQSIQMKKKYLKLHLKEEQINSEDDWKFLIDYYEEILMVYWDWERSDNEWKKSIKEQAKKESKESGQPYSEVEKRLMTQRETFQYDPNGSVEADDVYDGKWKVEDDFKKWKKQVKKP